MKRIDKIYEYIQKVCEEYTVEKLKNKSGFSATEIAEGLDILRNNVSMELNTLLRMDKIVKIKGRPVHYFDKEKLEQLLMKKLPKGPTEIEKMEDLIKEEKKEMESPFQHLIGAEGSLKNQIEQAKAAMLYPPNGLHTLILGQTGVGKTLFANMMYSYAKAVGRLKEESPFIVFNCADYYNTPQLLISQVFGHVKGAFTGADSDKSGIVEKANGGILFLDEIHRLPPEGQEMIFYFMDTGSYNKLGETDRKRRANVLIVAATTEDPNSSLLKTFVRRIPIIINIPTYDERPIKEKLDITKHLFCMEANRVNKEIRVSLEVVEALIGANSFGNIGQLKSNIQLICANGFLNSIDKKEDIELEFKQLPSKIKDGLLLMGNRRKEVEELRSLIKNTITINPGGYTVLAEDDAYEPPFNLYKIIEDKANILKEEGLDEEYITKFITTDINIHIKAFYDKFNGDTNNREKILKIVDKNIVDFAEKIQRLAEKKLNRKYNERFLYALSLHLSAFFNRLKKEQPLYYSNIEEITRDKPEEYKVAIEIKILIEEEYHIIVPDVETIYLTLLLSSIQEVQNGQVGILVAAHGGSTASSMVNVAVKLLGESRVAAIDMPLEVSPKEILEKVIEKVREIDNGKGVLLLVDMGSLSSFDSVIKERTNISVRTIDMVSTPVVLEAVRKANVFDMDLDNIYSSLVNFRGYSQSVMNSEQKGDKVIVTICSTGEGTAKKLKELIQDIVFNLTEEWIEVIPIGARKMHKDIENIEKEHTILATVGIINPNSKAPFISIESLIDGTGEEILKALLVGKGVIKAEKQKQQRVVVKDLCEDSLKQFLTYLNPYKITSVLFQFISVLENERETKFSNSMCIRLMIHTGCALERMVLREGLQYGYDKDNLDIGILEAIKKAAIVFKDSLKLELSEDEIAFIGEMLQ